MANEPGRFPRARAAARRLRDPAVLPWALALWLLASMFFHNDNQMRGDPGDGEYRAQVARGDGHHLFLVLRSLVLDRDLDLHDDLERFGNPLGIRDTDHGQPAIPQQIGAPLLWAPAMAVAHVASVVANLFGADVPAHGYTLFHQRAVFFTSVLLALGAALFGCAMARRLVGGRFGPMYAGLAVLLGTALTYYGTYMPSYSHAMEAFLVGAFLWAWLRGRGEWRPRRFALLGGLLGLAALVRVTLLLVGVVVAVDVAVALVAELRRRDAPGRARLQAAGRALGCGALCLGAALVAFIPQLLVWKYVHGEFLVSPAGEGFVDLTRPFWSDLLWSSRNGWLATHPIAYAGVVGLFFLPRGTRTVAAALLLAVALQVYVNASAWDWWAGQSFGARRMIAMTPVLVIGLAALVRACDRGLARLVRTPALARHGVALVVLGWFVTWNLFLIEDLQGGALPHGKAQPHAMCCEVIPERMRTIARPIYEEVGNPFALPASLVAKWRFGTTLAQWDLFGGKYAEEFGLEDYTSGRYRQTTTHWNVPGYNFGPFIVSGFAWRQEERRSAANPLPRGKQPRAFRWTVAPEATFLLPLAHQDGRRLSIPAYPNLAAAEPPVAAEVVVNGETRWTGTLPPGWSRIQVDVPASGLRRGVNVITVRAPLHLPVPLGAGAALMPPPPGWRPAGVAIGQVDVRFLP